MTKQLGIVMDPIERIQPYKDTSLALMLEAQRRGWTLHYFEKEQVFLKDTCVYAHAQQLEVFDDNDTWFKPLNAATMKLTDLDVILIRNEPPFDESYLYLTQLLDLVENQGVTVLNKPQSIRDVNEKIFAAMFPECCPPLLITQQIQQIRDFLAQQSDIIVKPLNGMGGQGVFRINSNSPNTGAILEMLTNNEQTPIMAQRYLPEIKQGDKRILMINGEPAPYALARIPAAGETRANLAAGGRGVAQQLSERDQWICEQVGETLKAKGLFFVGLDVIGDYLTEINVTSPTCARELQAQTDFDPCKQFFDLLPQY